MSSSCLTYNTGKQDSVLKPSTENDIVHCCLRRIIEYGFLKGL